MGTMSSVLIKIILCYAFLNVSHTATDTVCVCVCVCVCVTPIKET